MEEMYRFIRPQYCAPERERFLKKCLPELQLSTQISRNPHVSQLTTLQSMVNLLEGIQLKWPEAYNVGRFLVIKLKSTCRGGRGLKTACSILHDIFIIFIQDVEASMTNNGSFPFFCTKCPFQEH